METSLRRYNVRDLAKMKANGQKIAMLTAYDAIMARLADEAGVHLLLVGDSMGNTVLGYENTIPVTLEESLALTAAVRRGCRKAMVIGDLPFLSYQISLEEAVRNAGRYLKEAGADAVKLEGGQSMHKIINRLVEVGIPVMGHVGLLPQSVLKDGGYRMHGKSQQEAEELIEDAKAVQEAGAFAVVLEGIPATLAAKITAALKIPTISIGAGPDCDGQVQVITDVLGLGGEFVPKHAKIYANLGQIAVEGLKKYVEEVTSGNFKIEKNNLN